MELVDTVCSAPEADVLTIGEVFQFERDWFPELMGWVTCDACHVLTARAHVQVLGNMHVSISCLGYGR